MAAQPPRQLRQQWAVRPDALVDDDAINPQTCTVSAVLRRMLRHLRFYRRLVIVDSVRRGPVFPRQHFLNFLPEPHGKGSFWPTDCWKRLSVMVVRARLRAWKQIAQSFLCRACSFV